MAVAAPTLESLTGRRGVDIGSSFTRAWNERTGKTTKRSKDYPNPEYYSLRYNFKPESIDNEGAGSLTPKPGADGHIFELERPSLQNGDSHRFTAVEQPSKEWECVLLWDPATQQLTLEKLDATLNLNYEGRGKGNHRRDSPASSATQSSGTKGTAESDSQAAAAARDKELEDEIEAALTGYSDAEGEPDDEMDIHAEIEAIAGVSTNREEEEEEEEEEMERVDVEPPPPPPPASKPKAQPKAPQKAAPKAKAKGRTRANTSAKREADDFEEEELTFGEPTRRTARPTRSSTAHNSGANATGLALPAAPAQNRHAPPTPSDLLRPPSTTRITYAGSESGSDSDESDDGGQEGGEVLDAAALEREIEQVLAADGEGEVEEEEGLGNPLRQNGRHDSGRPLSLNELFGEQSQDDDSSSDDSDDD